MIKIKRAYDSPSPQDGARYYVDRLWPRGIKKENLQVVSWLRDVSPSDELRHWYNHQPEKWEEFKRRYFAELEQKPDSWQPLLTATRQRDVTLVFSSSELRINNAAALKEFLEARL